MALRRSAAPARKGRPLVAGIVLPAALVTALLCLAVALLATGGGRRAADKELDARAATVKRAWDAVGRPGTGRELERLGARLNAQLRVVSGTHPQAGTTTGKLRRYGFETRDRRTLRVALPTASSADAVNEALM